MSHGGAPGVRIGHVELLANDIAELVTEARDKGLTDAEVAAAIGAVLGSLAGNEENLQDIVGYARKHFPQ